MQKPLVGLTPRNAVSEVLAGVTLLAIAVPLNIGYAQIAGLPATAGLYALVLPSIAYVLLVSSRQVVASPDAAAAALVASSVGGLALAGSADYLALVFAQAVIGGVMFLLLAIFRLGFLANFLSKPILIGFVGGLALDILVSQVAKMLGVPIDSGGEFVEKLVTLATSLDEVDPWSAAIAAGSLVILLVGRRIARAFPWALVVLVLTTALVVPASLADAGVAVLGEVDAGLPALRWPAVDWTTWLLLIPSAAALTLVTTAEGLLVSRSYAEQHGYRTNPNRDLAAFGAANIASGISGGFSVGSSTSRTAAMDQAGSRTQLPSLVMAAGVVLLLLFGTALLRDIPSPAIGAIVAVAIVPLLGAREFAALWRADRYEFAIGGVCFVVTLLVGSIAGIFVAFVLALVNLARRAANPAIDVLASTGEPSASLLAETQRGEVTAPGIIVIRLAAPLFFANGSVFADAVKRAVRSSPEGTVRHVVVDMEAVTDIDVTGAEAFEALERWLDERAIELGFSRVRTDARARLDHFGLIGDHAVYPTNRDALAVLSGDS